MKRFIVILSLAILVLDVTGILADAAAISSKNGRSQANPATASSGPMSDNDFIKLCRSGTVQQIESAIKDGANVNAKDEDNDTALKSASWNVNPEVITVLIKNGADAKAKDKEGKRAIDYASENEKIKDAKAYKELEAASR